MSSIADAVLAAERAYVAAGLAPDATSPASGAPDARLAACVAGAIASRYLAVGTPNSFSVVAVDPRDAELSYSAHRVWFQPRDLRCTLPGGAAAIGGRVVGLDEALAADIVCVHLPLTLTAMQLRRGTHVNVLAACTLEPDLQRIAMIVHEHPGLGRLAAGLVDGRQLDELTIYVHHRM